MQFWAQSIVGFKLSLAVSWSRSSWEIRNCPSLVVRILPGKCRGCKHYSHPPREPPTPPCSCTSRPGSHSHFLMGFEGKVKRKTVLGRRFSQLKRRHKAGMLWRCLGLELLRRHEEGVWSLGCWDALNSS